MADLRSNFAGIRSPNPFWLASAPPTDKAYNVERAFLAGWGGVVWKTLGEDPPIVNVSSRYGALSLNGARMAGFNNIELITDRPLALNLQEITTIKRNWPDRAVVVSLMVPCNETSWQNILALVEPTNADGIELNFGCPHGMSERGMGAAVGQVPEYVEMVTRWCKQHTRMPVIVKLTPNVADIVQSAAAAQRGGADAVSLINTITSICAVDLDAMAPTPVVDGLGTHGGYCGPAVKPIALRMVAEIARALAGLPISGIGGIATWRDAAEFIALGASNVQICTAAMHYGFKIIDDMTSGLANWMDSKSYGTISDFTGGAVRKFVHWDDLNLNYKSLAVIDQSLCIKCGLCYAACEDTSHQAIAKSTDGARKFEVIDAECVGCNLCAHVCPVDSCITMVEAPTGQPALTWKNHPNNPASPNFFRMNVIEAAGLNVIFQTADHPVTALQNIDLNVSEGDFISLIGPSGCGKTTLLRAIADLTPPTSGTLLINGVSAAQARKNGAHGYVFQAPALFPWRNVARNVTLPLELRNTPRAERNKIATEVLSLVGLQDFGKTFPWQLSGGMQQRVSIARALSFRPKILLMDEPFGALDEITRDNLNLHVHELWRRTSMTCVFVTHSIPEAVFLSTRIVVMSPRPGRVLRIIETTLPASRTLDMRESPEFTAIAHEVRQALREGHSYE